MALAVLAEWIRHYRDHLTSAWVNSVRSDPRIQSDSDLSDEGLRDHIPAVIDEICELLRENDAPSIVNTREARVHAYVRFRQGYRARELVRELSLLRVTLLDHLAAGLSEPSLGLTNDLFAAAMRLIDLYIDEEMSYAVSVYVEVLKSDGPAPAPVDG